ncbi:MAG: glutamate synthase-related protein [Pseudomonadota bacterium]
MPKKYHIDVRVTPNRYPRIGRSGIVDWGEGCLKCPVCVKQECVYNVYRERKFSTDIMADTIDELCKSCFRCVQGCPRRLIHKTLNPEWEALGDDVYTPEIISMNWEHARTGKIPVSGAGYGGAFSGSGFDSMWTDMSEIVRPTRDGIHGREYISTVVDIGRRHQRLQFDADGGLLTKPYPYIRLPIPILFNILPFGDLSSGVWRAVLTAASRLETMALVPIDTAEQFPEFKSSIAAVHTRESWNPEDFRGYRMVELIDSRHVLDQVATLKKIDPEMIVSVRVPADSSKSADRIVQLAENGVEAVHCAADERGREPGADDGAHIADITREVHTALLRFGIRDEITLMVSGGLGMAEHVIKSMLCGANLVGVDVPLLIALECRVCRNCRDGGACPANISKVEVPWAAQRIVNLIGAWHNQSLEMMGAMGIREARRLRGEQGRVMFFEDLEAETFGRLFGARRQTLP